MNFRASQPRPLLSQAVQTFPDASESLPNSKNLATFASLLRDLFLIFHLKYTHYRIPIAFSPPNWTSPIFEDFQYNNHIFPVVRHGSLSGRRGRLSSKTKCHRGDEQPSPPLPLLALIVRAHDAYKSTPTPVRYVSLTTRLKKRRNMTGFLWKRKIHLYIHLTLIWEETLAFFAGSRARTVSALSWNIWSAQWHEGLIRSLNYSNYSAPPLFVHAHNILPFMTHIYHVFRTKCRFWIDHPRKISTQLFKIQKLGLRYETSFYIRLRQRNFSEISYKFCILGTSHSCLYSLCFYLP